MHEVSDSEVKRVIADFLEMGHVDNIISMFSKEPRYFEWTGELLQDGRFNVRLGLTILFEELQQTDAEHIHLAIPSLTELLENDSALLRGEAIGILGIIGTKQALNLISAMREDDSIQVREMVQLVLNGD